MNKENNQDNKNNSIIDSIELTSPKVIKKISTRAIENNELLKELLSKQLKTIPYQKKFDTIKCSKWIGYITNGNCENNKGTYINFYFRKKKAALHRLLYSNFIGELSDDEYLKFGCENKGTCCNIHHFKKFKYMQKNKVIIDNNNNENNNENNESNFSEIINAKKEKENKHGYKLVNNKTEIRKIVQIFN